MKTRLQSLGLLDRSIRGRVRRRAGRCGGGARRRPSGGARACRRRRSDARRPSATPPSRAGSTGRWRALCSCSPTRRWLTASRSSVTTPTTRRASSSREVLPGIVERHGLAITRMMLASTVAGEAAAATIIRDLLKHDDLVKLPSRGAAPDRPRRSTDDEPTTPSARRSRPSALEARKRKQDEAAQRREQSARDRGRV